MRFFPFLNKYSTTGKQEALDVLNKYIQDDDIPENAKKLALEISGDFYSFMFSFVREKLETPEYKLLIQTTIHAMYVRMFGFLGSNQEFLTKKDIYSKLYIQTIQFLNTCIAENYNKLTFEEIDLSLIDEAKVFHFGTLSLTGEPARSTTQKAVAYAKEQGKLITCDPNLRKPLWRSEEEAKEQIIWSLTQADVVKISDEEVEFLWNCTPEEGADKLLNEYDVSLAMVTLGPKGCLLKTKNAVCQVASPKVSPIDTTGAGDIFGGSAVSCLLDLDKAIDQLTEEDLTHIGRFATTAASLSTEHLGGIPSIQPKAVVLEHL